MLVLSYPPPQNVLISKFHMAIESDNMNLGSRLLELGECFVKRKVRANIDA